MMCDHDTTKAWTDILCCPSCHGTLEFIVDESPNEQSIQCSECSVEFPGVNDSFDLTIIEGEREREHSYYQQKYSSRSTSRLGNFDPEYWLRRWTNSHWPEGPLILNRLGDLNGKVVLCLGNGASTKELHFLTLGARLICSDLSMSGVLAAKSAYDLGELGRRAAFHAMDACKIPVRDESVDVVYGYQIWTHSSVRSTVYSDRADSAYSLTTLTPPFGKQQRELSYGHGCDCHTCFTGDHLRISEQPMLEATGNASCKSLRRDMVSVELSSTASCYSNTSLCGASAVYSAGDFHQFATEYPVSSGEL